MNNKNNKVLDCYVDGSYRKGNYYSGGVFIPEASKAFFVLESQFIKERQIGGECNGAILAMLYYLIHPEYSSVNIYFDFIGIKKWISGEWQANGESSRNFLKRYNKILNKIDNTRKNINFHHTKGHQKDNNIHHINNNIIDDIVGHVLTHNSYDSNRIYQWTLNDYDKKIKRFDN